MAIKIVGVCINPKHSLFCSPPQLHMHPYVYVCVRVQGPHGRKKWAQNLLGVIEKRGFFSYLLLPTLVKSRGTQKKSAHHVQVGRESTETLRIGKVDCMLCLLCIQLGSSQKKRDTENGGLLLSGVMFVHGVPKKQARPSPMNVRVKDGIMELTNPKRRIITVTCTAEGGSAHRKCP